MNRAERLRAVLDLLAEVGHVDVDQIVARLGVSPATARRDLNSLADQQLLTRTHGGAVGHSVAYDLPLRYKQGQRADAKAEVAREASRLVPFGAVVGLCGGTTCSAIAQALAERPDLAEPGPEPSLTIVTNAVNIAASLALRPQIKTVLTGGVVHPRSYELVGAYADAVLSKVTLDVAFIGVNGMDPQFGPTVHDESEAAINALMASRAKQAVLVCDSSKLERRAFAALGERGSFATLITDSGISAEQRAAFEDAGYRVVIAGG